MKTESPVKVKTAITSWRVDAVDVARRDAAVVLNFKGEPDQQAAMNLSAQQLRQWLSIVYRQYLRGEWPTGVWPDWLKESASPHGDQGGIVIH